MKLICVFISNCHVQYVQIQGVPKKLTRRPITLATPIFTDCIETDHQRIVLFLIFDFCSLETREVILLLGICSHTVTPLTCALMKLVPL